MRIRARVDHVRRVQRVAHLLLLQGSLELVVGLMMAFYWTTNLRSPIQGELGRFGQIFAPTVCVFNAISGVVKLAASLFNRRYRGWGLGMTAHLVAPLTLCSVYCLPTSALLAGYGLWVYSTAPVRAAFASAARGTPVADVEAALRGEAPGSSTTA